jgi:hypothetical protein
MIIPVGRGPNHPLVRREEVVVVVVVVVVIPCPIGSDGKTVKFSHSSGSIRGRRRNYRSDDPRRINAQLEVHILRHCYHLELVVV